MKAIGLTLALLLAPVAILGQQTPTQTTPPPATSTSAVPTSELPDAPTAPPPPSAPIQPTGPTAVLDTSMGRIACKLFEKEAPATVANFIGLAEGTKDWQDPLTQKHIHAKPYYDGLTFHRVIPGFMIQGGDPLANGEGDAGYFFNDEINPSLNFDVPGRLAMANSGPNTNGSQFFITEAPTEQLNQRYNLFGQCDAPGVLVVKMIARVQRNSQDKPLEAVTIDKVTIVRDGQPMPPPFKAKP